MAMTPLERAAKEQITHILDEEGYPTYADLFQLFELKLTNNPGVIGYMQPDKGRIVINQGLLENQVSLIIRHEILHEYLDHEMRLLRHLAVSHGLNPDEYTDDSLKELKQELYGDKTFNKAADYEISNRGYTEEDKETIRSIELNGKILSGLVTEDDHADWYNNNWSVEEMYDALKKEQMDKPIIIEGMLLFPTVFATLDPAKLHGTPPEEVLNV